MNITVDDLRKEMNRYAVPNIWMRTRRLIRESYRVRPAGQETGHWQGGPTRHEGADCFKCQRALRLVWDIDLRDSILPELLREVFSTLSRLPLYYCFNCPEATTYRVLSDTTVDCLDPAGHDGGDETPYAPDSDSEGGVPGELPRKAIEITRIPSYLDGLFSLESEIGFDGLDDEAHKQLGEYLGKEVSGGWDTVFSQLGGSPPMTQGHWDIECPNEKCRLKSQLRKEESFMKEIALIEEDSDLGFEWAYAPLAYHVCWFCGTIQGNFRCT